MIELTNKITGGKMRVAESRLDEYLAAGHKLAADIMPVPEATKEEAPKKRTPARRKKKE